MTEATIIQTQASMKETDRQEDCISLIRCIAQILEEILYETDRMEGMQTLFHAQKIPAISLFNYMQRIQKYAKCSDECYVIGLIYLDRVQEMNPDILLNSYCVHRFLITAIMLAVKYQDDDYYKNEYYAKIGGITVKEISQLEKEFLNLLQYQLYVPDKVFRIYMERLNQFKEI